MKEPFNAVELISQVNQYVALTDQRFNELGSYYIYCEKEILLKTLQDEYAVCEKILHKLNPANNPCIEIEVTQGAQTVTKIKEQFECRLNTLNKEYISVEEMVNELLSQNYLTSAERDRLDAFQESMRKKQKLASSDAYFDKTIKEMQEVQEEIQEKGGRLNQSLKQLDQRIIQLQDKNEQFLSRQIKSLRDKMIDFKPILFGLKER